MSQVCIKFYQPGSLWLSSVLKKSPSRCHGSCLREEKKVWNPIFVGFACTHCITPVRAFMATILLVRGKVLSYVVKSFASLFNGVQKDPLEETGSPNLLPDIFNILLRLNHLDAPCYHHHLSRTETRAVLETVCDARSTYWFCCCHQRAGLKFCLRWASKHIEGNFWVLRGEIQEAVPVNRTDMSCRLLHK